ncbi:MULTISPECIES: hypothetical protein [Klebsiella pneumoniae complex]|uniref:hypothetical protein n=1 Tax=Klebsiella pneumoniae complex TaxID=3390273 RepID=UPI00125B4B50|nr:hypothetical protein [Klebsiella variicola]VAS30332.1 Uncharacterised protein [Klebsiella variicola]
MTTDITELAQSEINDALAQLKQISEYPTPSTQYARVLRKYILSLVEALEKAQGMETYWKTQCRGITDHCEELQARIAELESRTVKLPAERFCPAEYAGSQLWSETEVWNKAITACADALRAGGIKVETE